jgi:hypothetical protein
MVLVSPLINQAGMYKCPEATRAFVDFIGDATCWQQSRTEKS